jgi:hypothetical protein
LPKRSRSPCSCTRTWQEVDRAKVARLVDALNDEHDRTEAAKIIRRLVDRIILTPKEGTLSIEGRSQACWRWL